MTSAPNLRRTFMTCDLNNTHEHTFRYICTHSHTDTHTYIPHTTTKTHTHRLAHTQTCTPTHTCPRTHNARTDVHPRLRTHTHQDPKDVERRIDLKLAEGLSSRKWTSTSIAASNCNTALFIQVCQPTQPDTHTHTHRDTHRSTLR